MRTVHTVTAAAHPTQLGQAKVRYICLSLLIKQDVGGLHVPVDNVHLLPVGHGQAPADVPRNPHHLRHRHALAVLPQPHRQVLPRHVLHHQHLVLVAHLLHRVHRHHVLRPLVH